jgi:hypothetical protein
MQSGRANQLPARRPRVRAERRDGIERKEPGWIGRYLQLDVQLHLRMPRNAIHNSRGTIESIDIHSPSMSQPMSIFTRLLPPIGLCALAFVGRAEAQVRPAVRPAPPMTAPAAKVEVVKTNLTLTSSSDERVPLAHRGVKSSDDENAKGERDSYAPIAMRAIPIGALSSKSRRLKDDPNVQAYLDKAKSVLNGFEINTALLAGHKYMISSCLGIKVSAGEFVLKVPDPDLRVDNTGLVLTFAIPHMEMSGFKLRFRPDITDPTEMCHFSGRYGVGASADNLRLELHFDPILDLEKCKIGSMGHITQIWRIGKLRMSPLPTEVSDMAGNIIEDALTNGANLNLADRVVAGFNAVAGLQCHP